MIINYKDSQWFVPHAWPHANEWLQLENVAILTEARDVRPQPRGGVSFSGMESTVERDRFAELLDAAAQVSEQSELHGLLESLVDIAMGLTGAKYGALGVVGAITRGETVRIDSIADHPDSTGMPEDHPPMSSFLGVPLRTRSELFGNIYLAEKAGGFTDEDQSTIETLNDSQLSPQ